MKYRVSEWKGVFRIEQFDEQWVKLGEFDDYDKAVQFVNELKEGTLL